MSDLMATVERLREAQELERLRAEVAELKARWNDYEAVNARAQRLAMMNYGGPTFRGGLASMFGAEEFGPSSLRKHMQAERFRLFGY